MVLASIASATWGISVSRFPVALCRSSEPGIFRQIRTPDDAAERHVLGVVADRHDDVALFAAEYLVRHHVRVRIAHPLGDLAGQKVVDGLVRIDGDHAIEQGRYRCIGPLR
jgi:hypothetical protein